jgi:hypothetical protein
MKILLDECCRTGSKRLNPMDGVEHSQNRAPLAATEMMVFEEIIRHSPRRQASPWIAEG